MPLHVYLEYTRAGLQAGRKKDRSASHFKLNFGVYFGVKLCLVGTVYISNKNRHNL